MKPPIIEFKNVSKRFVSGLIKTSEILAVKDATFRMKQGEILALVGESGSGKTTISNLIMQLISPTNGEILYKGTNISTIPEHDYYKNVQMVFQDPFSSYNKFYKVDRVLKQAIRFRYGNLKSSTEFQLMENALKTIEINATEMLGRYPHQLSGGQLQRYLLARALLIEPDLLIADEPTSMIDACSRAGVLNLLKKLRDTQGFSVLFITHDIGQAQYISDRVIVMKKGEIVEQGLTKEVFLSPKHAYTQKLLASVPSLFRKWGETSI